MSKYRSGPSRYCYPGTETLRNYFHIRREEQLQRLDAMLTSKRLAELSLKPLQGGWDFAHLCRIHAWIFQDLYPFAGKVRQENISKDGFTFAQAAHIEQSAAALFSALQQEKWQNMDRETLAKKLAWYFAEMNVLHPFRDGNGRSIREFIRALSYDAGFELNWAEADKSEVLEASIRSVTDPVPLEDVLYRLLKPMGKSADAT
ncbi:Fic/DOC family protein [Bacillus daqingensis]|uniref:protein adenylyltransferase n=2 Tax=Bacillus daqingensis TaxID=872396 RepID=A0ABV9NZ52_9BACI